MVSPHAKNALWNTKEPEEATYVCVCVCMYVCVCVCVCVYSSPHYTTLQYAAPYYNILPHTTALYHTYELLYTSLHHTYHAEAVADGHGFKQLVETLALHRGT
jgi:hypothetical protein